MSAIRSHTASAWAGSVTTSRRSRSPQLGVALAGEDQRQRDGAVEQVGAARACRCARPGRRRRARRRGSGTPGRCRSPKRGQRRRRAPACRRAARRAGRRPRTGWPSSARSARGSARRVTSVRPGVGALHQLAAGQRRGGRRQRAHGLLAAGGRPARRTRARTAGRRWRWRRARPPAANTVGRPRRSGARSSTSSCTSVAMCSSSTATPAATRRVVRSSPPQRNTSIGPQALAARRRACPPRGAQLGPVALGDLRQPRLGAVAARAASSGPPASSTERELRPAPASRPPRHRARVDGDDPARGEHPAHVGRGRPRPARPPAPAGPGKRRTELGR